MLKFSLDNISKWLLTHHKGIIGTLIVIFFAFLVSVGSVYLNSDMLMGTMKKGKRIDTEAQINQKVAGFSGRIMCQDTDSQNDMYKSGTVLCYNKEDPKKERISKADECESNINTRKYESIEYICNSELFPDQNTEATPEQVQAHLDAGKTLWAEAARHECPGKCGINVCKRPAQTSVRLTFNGPQAQDVVTGGNDVLLIDRTIRAENGSVKVDDIDISIEGVNGGIVRGTAGTDYFTDIRLVNINTGEVLGGPFTASQGKTVKDGARNINAAAQNAHLAFQDSFTIQDNSAVRVGVYADIAEQEDAARDEFHGEAYKVVWQAADDYDYKNASNNEWLGTQNINPSGTQNGNHFTVTPPEDRGNEGDPQRLSLSRPSVSVISSNRVLVNGPNREIFRFSIRAVGGRVAVKKFTFDIDVTEVSGNSLGLNTFNIGVDIHDLNPEHPFRRVDVSGFENGEGNDISGELFSLGVGRQNNTAIVVLAEEEIISEGQTKTFIVKANIFGVGTGDTISTGLSFVNDTTTMARYLVSEEESGSNNITDLGTMRDGSGVNSKADFIWSDMSWVPHSNIEDDSSRDWANGYQIELIEGQVNLTL